MRGYKYILIWSLLLWSLTSCTTSPATVSCFNLLQGREWSEAGFGFRSTEQMKQWIKEEFSIPIDQIIYDEAVDGSESILMWGHEEVSYRATFRQDRLQSVNVIWDSSHPVGKDVLACFGPPELYQAFVSAGYGPPYRSVSLWYPSLGVVARALHFPDEMPPLDADLPMTSLTLVKPGDLDEVVTRAHRYPNEVLEGWIAILRPWPGSWQALEVVDYDPSE